jgi:putative SOS response-associated peptidase YedK
MLSDAELAAIKQLKLAPDVEAAARILKDKHHELVFTSGLRSITDQAGAMASNIIKSGHRNWIAKTYLAAEKLQQWVDRHPEAITREQLATGLEATMKQMTSDELRKVSKHLIGRAFDLTPVSQNVAQIEADIQALPNFQKFLTKEGGLVRWHVQFTGS